MMHTVLEDCGYLFLFSVMTVFAFGAWMIATGERKDRYAPVMPEPEPNLPLSDAMRDAIRRDVSAAIDRDARTAWARGVMAFHASGHGVRKATVEDLVGVVVEVARG